MFGARNVSGMNRASASHLGAEQSILMSPLCIATPMLIPGKLQVDVTLYVCVCMSHVCVVQHMFELLVIYNYILYVCMNAHIPICVGAKIYAHTYINSQHFMCVC